MIGVIRLPRMPLDMGVMGSDWRQATSPGDFMVIDDKGGEEHGLKIQLGKAKEKKEKSRSQFSSECLF